MAVIYWLIIFVVLIVGEFATLQLVSIWFAVGAFAGMIAAIIGAGFKAQIICFLAVSFVLLLAVKPVTKKIMKKKVTKTNVDSLIGQNAKVTGMIDNQNGFGTVVVKGQEWTAVAENDDVVIQPGKLVIIKKVSGVKLVVGESDDNK